MSDLHGQAKKKKKQRRNVKNQKAIIDTRIMEKNFDTTHAKYVQKLRKLGPGENIVLPLIKNTKENPMFLESKKYYKTEGSKNGDYDDSRSGSGSGGSSNGRSGSRSVWRGRGRTS